MLCLSISWFLFYFKWESSQNSDSARMRVSKAVSARRKRLLDVHLEIVTTRILQHLNNRDYHGITRGNSD